ncbi:MAG: hypothetical protein BBJ57_02280 [Desulfobacterales bacterium PC51MH44]|nr:MAG: hypothetical protein BBJ57_02280 [Desulfobacterales bacterium PC51MH44]
MAKSALQTSTKPKRKSYYKPVVVDKRNKNGKKIDLAEVVKLRDVQGLSFPQIGKILGFDQAYVNRVHTNFKSMVQPSDLNNAFTDNRVSILNSMELNLLQNLGKADKLEKASLNNVAYAFNQIHTARRLEQGLSTGNVAISIETVYQDAEKEAKALRKQHSKVEVSVNSEGQE